jgi:GMP synthase-like glutamine amidotransferase
MKKLLVVQFRTDDSREHEQICFGDCFNKRNLEIEYINCISEELPKDVSEYAGVVLGGSAEFMLTKGNGKGTWLPKVFTFLDNILATEIPMFTICFGYQILSLHGGAKIVCDENMRETGTYDIFIHDSAKDDALFAKTPSVFRAQFAHKDTIVDYPDHFIPLSYSKLAGNNAYRIKGKNVWGVLFHPELNKARMAERLPLYPEYLMNTTLEEALKDFDDTPDAADIFDRFLNVVEKK